MNLKTTLLLVTIAGGLSLAGCSKEPETLPESPGSLTAPADTPAPVPETTPLPTAPSGDMSAPIMGEPSAPALDSSSSSSSSSGG